MRGLLLAVYSHRSEIYVLRPSESILRPSGLRWQRERARPEAESALRPARPDFHSEFQVRLRMEYPPGAPLVALKSCNSPRRCGPGRDRVRPSISRHRRLAIA